MFRHRLGTRGGDDELVYEEQDAGLFTGHRTAAPAAAFASSTSATRRPPSCRLIDLADPTARRDWSRPRESACSYSLDHCGDGCSSAPTTTAPIDFKLAVAPLATPARRTGATSSPISRGLYVIGFAPVPDFSSAPNGRMPCPPS